MGFTNGIRVGRVMGIPIIINPSWLLVLGLVVFALSGQFSVMFPRWPAWQHYLAAAVTGVLFFASVLAHELSHSLLAVRKGLPVRGITFFLLGGVSQIGREANRPSTELLVAVVGPLCSLVLGGVFVGIAYLVRSTSAHLWGVLALLGQANLVLGVFNLAPAFPLDGGRVLRSALWATTRSYARATAVAVRISQGLAAAMVLAGIAVALLVSPFSGLWMALIGWFLFGSAGGAIRQQRLEEALRPLRAREVMVPGMPVASEDESLSQVVERLLLPPSPPCLLVGREGVVTGVITMGALRRVPRSRWPATSAGSIATPLSRFPVVSPDEAALDAVEQLERSPEGLLLVAEGTGVVGALTRESVAQRLRAMEALGMVAR